MAARNPPAMLCRSIDVANLARSRIGTAAPDGSAPRPLDGHALYLYESDDALVGMVAGFLADGLQAGDAVVVIATDSHAAGFRARLTARGLDTEAAGAAGRLCFIDARAMLDLLLVDGEPDRARFDAHIGGTFARAAMVGAGVRAYGEMVDILWREGRQSAAIRLEELWNQLATVRPFSLLCAYAIGGFHGDSGPEELRSVCSLHDGSGAPEPRMQALEAEIRERQRLEAALRQSLADQQAVEAELRERNEELHDFFENAVEGLHCVGPDGVILWANPAELALLGYARDEYVGHHIAEFHVDGEVISDMLERVAHNETVRDREARLRCKDGSIKHVRISTNALFRDGRFVHTRCFTRDVTAETLAREQTSRLLEAAVDEARAKDEFIAMLSHELRGPLAPIRSALHLMQLRGDSGVGLEREVIDRQVGNLVRLVDDLLDASRVASGKIEVQRERIDLADVIDLAVEIAAPVLQARDHALEVRAGRGDALVDGDRVRLVQVLANLLSNAAKYTERGGRIWLDLRVEAGQALLAVRDNGIGIDGHLLPRVFERGVQGRHGIGGLGLGLAIVRAFVELHGGAVTAHSAGRGRGSEFRIALPLAASPRVAEPTAPAETAARAEPAPAPTRLLIVDDDIDLAGMLAELMGRRGFTTQVARDGEEAIRAFAEFSPHAALIDISLPLMNGCDLARRLRETGTGARLIALSGYGRREDEEASLAAGFDVHLVKPVLPDLIEAHLRDDADPPAQRPGSTS